MALEDGVVIIHDKTYEEYLSAVVESFQSKDEIKLQFTKSERKMNIANKIEKKLYPLGIRAKNRTHFNLKLKDSDKEIVCEEQKLFKIPILKESLFS